MFLCAEEHVLHNHNNCKYVKNIPESETTFPGHCLLNNICFVKTVAKIAHIKRTAKTRIAKRTARSRICLHNTVDHSETKMHFKNVFNTLVKDNMEFENMKKQSPDRMETYYGRLKILRTVKIKTLYEQKITSLTLKINLSLSTYTSNILH